MCCQVCSEKAGGFLRGQTAYEELEEGLLFSNLHSTN